MMLDQKNYIETIDAHTMGEATRIVIDGLPAIQGKTMMKKKNYMKANMEYVRRMLMFEPRGHLNMFGAVLTEPCNADCDLGVLFMDSGGYLNMCGHGTIATVTIAINNGIIAKKDKIRLDTPSGIVECDVFYERNEVDRVSFTNVPSFVLRKNQTVSVKGLGEIELDIAFGGSIFAIVDANKLNLKLQLEEQETITKLGMAIKEAVNQQVHCAHPQIEDINTVDLVEFSMKKANNYYKNVVVFGNGQIDRSPCGTGTCAKLATLHLKKHEKIIQESILGSRFTGEIVDFTKVANYDAIIPKITGSAWMTGMHKFVLETSDPYQEGFLLN